MKLSKRLKSRKIKGWIDIKKRKPNHEGNYIVEFNGHEIPAYWDGKSFYELSFDQSPDWIPARYYTKLPKFEI